MGKTVFENAEKLIIENFTKDVKFIENKIIQNFEKNVQSKINNTELNVKGLSKRLNENNEIIQGVEKKIKNNENDHTKLLVIGNKIENKNNLIEKLSYEILQQENDIKSLKNIAAHFDDAKNEIIKDNSFTINTFEENISKNITLKFQNFVERLNNRVDSEITNFNSSHDVMNKHRRDIERSLNMHLLVHKNDTNKTTQQLSKILAKIKELKKKASVGDLKQIENKLLIEIKSINEKHNEIQKDGDIKNIKDKLHNELNSLKEEMNELHLKLANVTKLIPK